MSELVTAIFENRKVAEAAATRLVNAGFGRNDISVVMSDGTRSRDFDMQTNTKAPEGAATGGAIGGTLGAIAAGLTAVGTIATGGAGLIAAGPIVAALAGGGAGGAAGGILGGLIGAGMPEHEAKAQSDRLEKGDILVGVEAPDDRVSTAKDCLKASGGESVKKN